MEAVTHTHTHGHIKTGYPIRSYFVWHFMNGQQHQRKNARGYQLCISCSVILVEGKIALSNDRCDIMIVILCWYFLSKFVYTKCVRSLFVILPWKFIYLFFFSFLSSLAKFLSLSFARCACACVCVCILPFLSVSFLWSSYHLWWWIKAPIFYIVCSHFAQTS